MELTGIIAGLLLAVGGLSVLAGLAAHNWVNAHHDVLDAAVSRAGDLTGRLVSRTGAWRDRGPGGQQRRAGVLAITLLIALALEAMTMAGVAVLVDAVTDGDGIAMVDHPIANFVAGHRAQVLTSAMKVASSAGGPLGMSALAVVAGVLLSVAWRSAMPAIVLAVTGAGVAALAQVFKVALGRARPPLAQAAATAPGYSFPSGHAAAAAAILGATAWLLSMRVRSWRGRTAIWSCAAMLAALIGISRVYLGVHWTTDVIGGWVFGIAWLAVVVCCLAAFGLTPMARSPTEARGTR